jgi:hypothetical protein
MMMIPFSVLLTILVAGLVARWVVSAWPGGDGHELAGRDAQIRRLREEMDTLQSEVRRLSEEQSFMVRLLSKGDVPPAGQLPSPANEPQSESP